MSATDQQTGEPRLGEPGRGQPPGGEPRGDGRRELPPRLAEGIELLGEYEDSGFKEPHYVARRADGQVLRLSKLLHLVAENANGRRGYRDIAERVSEGLGRKVSADNVRFLADKKLRPLGVLAAPDGSSPKLEKADPLLALKFRAAVVPERLTRALTTVFLPFFFPPVVVAVVAALVAVDVWFFLVHGAAQPARELLYNPLLLLMVLGLVVLATALHEIGHATALRYGGGRPGVMGAGVYVVWPAFYTDVTDAYRLGRGGRLRTDLGGVYFNVLFILGTVAAYALTGFEPVLVLVVIQHMQILQQMLPFLRLDGYYVLSDLTGVPDLFARIKPTLKSALPGRDGDKRVEELKPWVRAVTTAWVLFLIPVLLFVFGLLVFNAPRMVATAWDSLHLQLDRFRDAGGLGKAGAAFQMVALALPLGGMTYTFGRVSKRVVGGAWSWSEGSVLRRGVVALATAALAATAAWVLLPNGDYRPIQPGERGTLQGGVAQFRELPSGRPGLARERERELGGAPTKRERGEGAKADEAENSPTPAQEEERDEQEKRSPPSATQTSGAETTGGTGDSSPREPTQTAPAAGATAPAETTETGPADTAPTETTTP